MDILPLQPFRITAPVEFFMMLGRNRRRGTQDGPVGTAEDVRPHWVWFWTVSRSFISSGNGLLRICSGTTTLPISCIADAIFSIATASGRSP